MSNEYPVLQVQDVQPVIEKATLGLVALEQNLSHDSIETFLGAVADGTPPAIPEWTDEYEENAIAVSYVHTVPSQWYGRISRGKFASDTKQRLVQELHSRHIHAFWLDQSLAQRKGDGDAGWAVFGLLPYAVMPVLVIGNFEPLHTILESYVQLERLPQEILSLVATELQPLLETAWSSIRSSPARADNSERVINFVEMCRFWPMMERALAHKAKGLVYEQHTIHALKNWIKVLGLVKHQLDSQSLATEPTSDSQKNIGIILSDLQDMVLYILLQRNHDEDHFTGLGYNVLSALTIVTSALGSGAMANAKLYQPEDRNALLVAGMCFNLLANMHSDQTLRGREIVQIVEDPYRAFGILSEKVPATHHCIANALAGANGLYNRPALDQPSVPHAGIADEVTIYSKETATVPISRRWNGQWELVPHLSLCMRAQLIDIGERSMNSEPYDDFVLRQCFSEFDITGKTVQAALCRSPLQEKHSSIPLIAISLFGATWALRSDEREIFEKHGLRGWTSRVLFLGECDTIRKKVSIAAIVVCHMTVLEEDDQLLPGRIAKASALRWLKMLIRRSSCPLHKRAWLLRWISTNFDNIDYTWYCGVRINLHHFTWEKWVSRAPSTSTDNETSHSITGSVRFVKLSRVTVETLTTCPQLPLEDVIRFVQAAMLLSHKSILNDPSSHQTENVRQVFTRHVFETWLGLLTGLYRAYELQYRITGASKLRLLLPGYKTMDETIELTTEDILASGSRFMEGLARSMPTTSELTIENGHSHLQWDTGSSTTFWEVKEIVFNTAHAEGMLLTLMLICLTTAAHESNVGPSSADVNSETDQGPSAPDSAQVLEYQIDHAIKKLCRNLTSSGEAHDVVYTLIEHVVTNTRLPREQIDWRIPPEYRRIILEVIMSSSSKEYHALTTQADTVFDALEKVHAAMCHVRTAKIAVEPDQSFADGTRACFKSMLRIQQHDAGNWRQISGTSFTSNALRREEEFTKVIPTHDVDVNPTDENGSRQKKLVLVLEFFGRQ